MVHTHRRELTRSRSLLILAAWAALMHLSFRREARRRKESGDASASDRSAILLKHRNWLLAWLVENGAVCIQATVGLIVNGGVSYRHQDGKIAGWRTKLLRTFVGIVIAERIQLTLHWLAVHRVYRSIPYFHPGDYSPSGETHASATDEAARAGGSPDEARCRHAARAASVARGAVQTDARPDDPSRLLPLPRSHCDLRAACREYLCGSATAQLLLSVLVLARPAVRLRGPWSVRRFAAKLDPLALCAKLAVVRTVVDVCFAAGHWTIHRPAIFRSRAVSHRISLQPQRPPAHLPHIAMASS